MTNTITALIQMFCIANMLPKTLLGMRTAFQQREHKASCTLESRFSRPSLDPEQIFLPVGHVSMISYLGIIPHGILHLQRLTSFCSEILIYLINSRNLRRRWETMHWNAGWRQGASWESEGGHGPSLLHIKCVCVCVSYNSELKLKRQVTNG